MVGHAPTASPLARVEPRLMGQSRAVVWGPADFVGLPPWWLTGEGLLAGVLGAGFHRPECAGGRLVRDPRAGTRRSRPVVRCGTCFPPWRDAGRTGADRHRGVLGMGLALVTSGRRWCGPGRARACRVRGRDVGAGRCGDGRPWPLPVLRGRYLCSVADRYGAPLEIRIWRGCGKTTRPGDALAVVYDPKGRASWRSVETGASRVKPLRDAAGWAEGAVCHGGGPWEAMPPTALGCGYAPVSDFR